MSKIRPIAFFLPQYHPIPENDEWWGKGFTEWRNVVKTKPLFKGHYQPHLPADLGFYDLRLPETRIVQANLAKEYGIHGFCYYHYWFNGKRLLERPFEEVLNSGEPDFPFCLCWANESWTRRWDGQEKEILAKQIYSQEDDLKHIRYLAKAFSDPRYIRIEGKPLFLVYRASALPDAKKTTDIWREEANRLGIGEIFLCRVESFPSEHSSPSDLGFDASVEFQPDWANLPLPLQWGRRWSYLRKVGLVNKAYGDNRIYYYADLVSRMTQKPIPSYLRFPCVTPSWDNTARRKQGAVIFKGSTPELYGQWLEHAVQMAKKLPSAQRFVFINAWNEWAEGNHLEPCQRWGVSYLETTRQVISNARYQQPKS
ncbi:MAG: glycoside hydrolase family 99-like domain-containing protein [Saprospiraceae bacterium]